MKRPVVLDGCGRGNGTLFQGGMGGQPVRKDREKETKGQVSLIKASPPSARRKTFRGGTI